MEFRRERHYAARAAKALAIAVTLMLFSLAPISAATYGTLTITSSVAKAEVYLDGDYLGLAPQKAVGLTPGIHRLLVQKNGYERDMRAIRVEGGIDSEIRVDLVPARGTVVVEGLPQGAAAEVLVDARAVIATEGVLTLPEGGYTVEVSVFGYRPTRTAVSIKSGSREAIPAPNEIALFQASALTASRQGFDPEAPSGFDFVDILFSVTAPGTGTLSIADETGNTLRTIELPPFASWRVGSRWDGRDDGGKTVPDGLYTITLSARAGSNEESNAEAPGVLTTTVRVERRRGTAPRFAALGVGSVGPVTAARLLGGGDASLSFEIDASERALCPGISVSGGFTDFLEAGLSARATLHSPVTTNASENTDNTASAQNLGGEAALGLKLGARQGNWAEALAISWRCASAENVAAIEATPRGLSLGPAISFALGSLVAGASERICLGDTAGFFHDPDLTLSSGISLELSRGGFCLASWLSADSSPLAISFDPFDSLAVGFSVGAAIPGTRTVLSIEATIRDPFSDEASASARAGARVGL